MSSKAKVSSKAPTTKIGADGTAKRNIIRKAGGGGGGGGGGGDRKSGVKGGILDDGTMYDDRYYLSKDDPVYDSAEEEGTDGRYEYVPPTTVYTFTESRDELAEAKINLTTFKKAIEPIIAEYFTSGDVENLILSVTELAAPQWSYELVKRSINMSLDKADRERELVSRMFSTAYPKLLSSNMVGKGFERIFELADEIEMDCPDARNQIATFLARAVVDEVVPPSFLSDPVVCNIGGDIVMHAKRLLSRDHAGAQLERIWGPGDGRPVKDLKIAIDLLLKEYLENGLCDEAARCIREINGEFYHHEIIKRAITNSLDRSEASQQSMSDLLNYLVSRDIVSQTQCIQGFRRVYGIVSDLTIDTPNALALIHEFTQRAIDGGVLTADCAAFLEKSGTDE